MLIHALYSQLSLINLTNLYEEYKYDIIFPQVGKM
jgi:hypothetical protein